MLSINPIGASAGGWGARAFSRGVIPDRGPPLPFTLATVAGSTGRPLLFTLTRAPCGRGILGFKTGVLRLAFFSRSGNVVQKHPRSRWGQVTARSKATRKHWKTRCPNGTRPGSKRSGNYRSCPTSGARLEHLAALGGTTTPGLTAPGAQGKRGILRMQRCTFTWQV